MNAVASDINADALDAMRADGLLIDAIQWDAGFQRVPTEAKPRSKNGSYITHSDKPAATVIWWNFDSGAHDHHTAKTDRALTAKEKA